MPEDLYSAWLKIPPGVRPPDHYALLGLPRFCNDLEKIDAATQQRLDALDRYALHPDLVKRDACQQMMNEVARARVVLINPQKRRAYDLTFPPAEAPTARTAEARGEFVPAARGAPFAPAAPFAQPMPFAQPAPFAEAVSAAPFPNADPSDTADQAGSPGWAQEFVRKANASPVWWIASIAGALLVGVIVIGLLHSWYISSRNSVAVGDQADNPTPAPAPLIVPKRTTLAIATTAPAQPPSLLQILNLPATRDVPLTRTNDPPFIGLQPDDSVIGLGPGGFGVGPSQGSTGRPSVPTPPRVDPTPVITIRPTVTPPVTPPVASRVAPPVVSRIVPPVALPALDSVPIASEQAVAWKLVNEIFADEIATAKTPDAKAAVAKKMLVLAAKTQDDPVGRYVLLSHAGDLATQGADVETALAAVDEVAKQFQIDALKVKARALVAMSKLVTAARKNPALPAQMEAFIAQALAADRYDLARDASTAAAAAATQVRDITWAERIQAQAKPIAEAQAEFLKIADTWSALEKDPADPDANFRIGSYRCFVKEDWPAGLPLLAIGSDPAIKNLALADLNNPTYSDQIIGLGDGWWGVADRLPQFERVRVKRHAAEIYTRLLSKTGPIPYDRLQKRLDEVENSLGRLVNLLPMLDLDRDADGGTWLMDQHGLYADANAPGHPLRLRYHPPDEYDLRVEFIAFDKRVSLELFLTHAGHLFGCNMGSAVKGYTSLYTLDAIDGNIQNRASVDGPILEHNSSHTILIKVRRDRVAAYIDDGRLLDFATDYGNLKLQPRADHADYVDDGLGLNVPAGPIMFTRIELIEITGAGHTIAHRNRE